PQGLEKREETTTSSRCSHDTRKRYNLAPWAEYGLSPFNIVDIVRTQVKGICTRVLLFTLIAFQGGSAMPKGTRVERCVQHVKAKADNVNPQGVVQASPKKGYQAAKPLSEGTRRLKKFLEMPRR